MKLFTVLFLVSASFLLSCSPNAIGTITFTPPDNEIIVRSMMKEFMAANASPRIVLRTSLEKGTKGISEEDVNAICNAIEKELTKADFQVKDRKTTNLTDSTATDLILDVVKKNSTADYQTNVYTTKSKKEKVWKYGVVEAKGILFECKFIIAKTNDVGAIFEFNYVDCMEGCKYELTQDGKANKYQPKADKKTKINTLQKNNPLEIFMRENTKKMLASLR
jgi:hypothetical protein